MGKVISICNLKGGVGKTTTTVNLAAALSLMNFKTLVIDTDPQANSSMALGKTAIALNNPSLNGMNLFSVLRYHIIKTENKVDLIPYIKDLPLFSNTKKKEYIQDLISRLKSTYDFIIIDCIPNLQQENFNILSITNSVIIPVQCDIYAVNALFETLKAISYSQKNDNKNLEIEGFLITMFRENTKITKIITEYMSDNFKELVFKIKIRSNTAIVQAQSEGKSILRYDANSKGAKDYSLLAQEIIAKNNAVKKTQSAIKDVDIPTRAENSHKQSPTIEASVHRNTLYKKVSNNTVKKQTVNSSNQDTFEHLLKLTKYQIEQELGAYTRDYMSNQWVYKIKNNKKWYHKRYLYLYFTEGLVSLIKKKWF